jgi:GTP-binding protein EngB required for normal cell division
VFQEKKTFNKQLIRSRQLKRCFMILLSKQPLPFDAKEFKKLIEHSQEIVHWKIINKMDDIEKARQLAAEANRAKRAKFQLESKDMIKMIASAIKRDEPNREPNREVANLIQQYDQASCEVEVY